MSLLLLVLMGLALALGGGYLLYLGGSPFYLFSGLVMLAVAAGLWRRRRWALWLYAAWLLALLVWSLWEVGLHWWPLATRLGIPVLIGLLLALPAVRRNPQGTEGGGHFGPAWPVLGTALLSAAVALSGIPRPLHEIEGTLAMDIVTADARLGDGALPEGEWTAYGRTQHGQRYSPLKQITPANVHQLEVAWQIRTGDMRGPKDIGETTYQATPLKVHGLLYLCTPHSWAMALDADTGKERWRFDPQSGLESKRQHQTCRGVAYHGSAAAPAAATTAAGAGVQAASLCANRIFLPTADAKLYALDAATGKPCADFGKGGALDLTHNMPFKQPGFYYSTSPPVVAGDRVIVSGAVNDNYDVRSPRASSARTTCAAASCCGTGTRATPRPPRPSTRTIPRRPTPPPRPTAGRWAAPTRSWAWRISPWATARRTSWACTAMPRRRSTRPRWWRWTLPRAGRAGCGSSCTTTSGTWTRRPSRCCWTSTCRRAARRPSWCRPSRAISMCWTGATAARCMRSANAPRRRAPISRASAWLRCSPSRH
ncbi:hypothetical protein ACFQOZ_07915 [Comamonas endophytica]|uniref:hypothetical protein n=1 Tax=Comamonas endophytica TaxID=2949090 RepID=UPI003618BD5E